MARRPDEPVGNFNFDVEIDGQLVAWFTAVDGLSVEQEMVEYRFGESDYIRKRPGLVKFGDITFKSGYITDPFFQDWIESTFVMPNRSGDKYTRKTVSIILFDHDNTTELRRWNLYECHPKSWKISGFDAKGSDAAVEELVLSIEYFEGE